MKFQQALIEDSGIYCIDSWYQERGDISCLFRYSLGEMPTYCLKYFPKKDCVGKFSLTAISLILRSVFSYNCFASVITI